MVYYSSIGDIQSLLTIYYLDHTIDPEIFAERLLENSKRYLVENLLGGTVGISWWKNLKVYKGYLAKRDSYREMMLEIEGVESLLENT